MQPVLEVPLVRGPVRGEAEPLGSAELLLGNGQFEDLVDEIDVPDQGWKGLTLRLFDQETEEWSLNWSSSRTGRLFPPVTGRFGPDGRGEFFGDDTHEGKEVRARFVWSGISATTARWEQAFSLDGGVSWLTNWTMEFTRRPAPASGTPAG